MARPSDKARAAVNELGHVQSIYGDTKETYIPMLSGMSLRKAMEMMAETDDTVGAIMFCITTTMAQAEWSHVPQVDAKDEEGDQRAIDAADFANTLLVDMNTSMQEHIEDALQMVIYGFAPCEIVAKQRNGVDSIFNDKLYGLKKLPFRDPMTVWDWQWNGEDVVGMHQMSWRGSATIPTWKLLHYRTTGGLDRPWGRSLLKNAYRDWRLKNQIQDSEAIGIERDLCGLPVFEVPQEVLDIAKEKKPNGDPTDQALVAQGMIRDAIKAVSDMRFNRSGGLIIPSDTFADEVDGDKTKKWSFRLVTSAGQRSIDTRTAARDYDRAIARLLMMQFLHLGDRSTGSYAMSDDQSSLAVRALMSLAKKFATEWRRKVLDLIWSINAMDKRYMPRLRATELNKDGIVQLGQFFGGIAKSEKLWSTDYRARTSLLKIAGVSYDPKAQRAAADRATVTEELPAKTQEDSVRLAEQGQEQALQIEDQRQQQATAEPEEEDDDE